MPRRQTVAEFLSRSIAFCGKTQREIAREAGFERPNVISMMRTGEMKVPLDRIPMLADALTVDAGYFLRLALAEYHPDVYTVLLETFGDVYSKNERNWMAIYQLCAMDEEIELTAEITSAALDLLLKARGVEDEDEA